MTDLTIASPSGDELRELKAAAIHKMSDTAVVELIETLREQRKKAVEELRAWETLAEAEITKRLQERGARALPHPELECELVDEYSEYAYDVDALREARAMLPEDEGLKLVQLVPELTTIVPAHYKAGNPRSITAIVKKYAGSPVAAILEHAMTRSFLGTKVVVKRRPKAVA